MIFRFGQTSCAPTYAQKLQEDKNQMKMSGFEPGLASECSALTFRKVRRPNVLRDRKISIQAHSQPHQCQVWIWSQCQPWMSASVEIVCSLGCLHTECKCSPTPPLVHRTENENCITVARCHRLAQCSRNTYSTKWYTGHTERRFVHITTETGDHASSQIHG